MNDQIAQLIDELYKLKEEGNQAAMAEKVSRLQQELYKIKKQKDSSLSTRRVSVILPEQGKHTHLVKTASHPESPDIEVELPEGNLETPPKEEATAPVVEVPDSPIKRESRQTSLWEEEASQPTETVGKKSPVVLPAQQNSTNSINDKLRQEREEIGTRLANTPISDLTNAIGLNEKYVFINELFRKNESLYRRSLKTINQCRDLDEALYWIDRELKIKLSWQDDNKVVQQFYNLVKKRFS